MKPAFFRVVRNASGYPAVLVPEDQVASLTKYARHARHRIIIDYAPDGSLVAFPELQEREVKQVIDQWNDLPVEQR